MRQLFFALLFSVPLLAADGLVSVDHSLPVKSTVPMMTGQTAQIYVREVVEPGNAFTRRSRPTAGSAVRSRRWNAR